MSSDREITDSTPEQKRVLLKAVAKDGPDWLVDSMLRFSNAFLQVDQKGGCQSGQMGFSDKVIYFQIHEDPKQLDRLQTMLKNTVMVKAKEQEGEEKPNPIVLKKTTQFVSTCLIADGVPDAQGDVLNIDRTQFPAVVPVSVNFRSDIPPVGLATLTRHGNKVKASISLYEGIKPEDLFNLRPCFGGKTDTISDGEITYIDHVTEIGLNEKNADDRIPTLGEGFIKQDS